MKINSMRDVAATVRGRRKDLGLSQADLAARVGVSRAWINFAKTGNPSQPGLEFKPYAKGDEQTMVFDIVSGCQNLHYDKFHALMPKQEGFGLFFRKRA